MQKTPAEIYQDIDAVNSADTDVAVAADLFKEAALALANMAVSLEGINLFVNGPVITPTAASLRTRINNLSPGDRSPKTRMELLKSVGLLSAKMAMETESIRIGLSPQLFSYEANVAISFGGGANNLLSYQEDLGASMSMSVAFDHNRPYSAKVFDAGTALTAEFQSV